MAISKYQKFGLRRERNLSDVSDKKEALSSLLDDFTSPKGQLVADDILVISGLRDTAITTDKLLQLNGQVRQFLPTDADTGFAGSLQNAIPLETLNDKIENLKVVLGDPPFATGGGDGLKAIFYKIENVKPEAEINASTTGDQVLKQELPNPNGIAGPVDFWDNGRFLFGTTLHPDFDDQYGLVQWEGYYSGKETFFIETTGLFIVEYNFEDGTGWKTLKSVYNTTRQLPVVTGGTNVTTFTVSSDTAKHICIGDTVIGDAGQAAVSELTTAGTVTLDGPVTLTNGGTVTVTTDIGNRITRTQSIAFPLTFFGGKLKVRFTLWFPYNEQNIFYTKKSFDLEIVTNSIDNFPFNFFYSDYDPNKVPGRETFQHFRENSLSARNQTVDTEFTTRGLFKSDFFPLINTSALAAAPYDGQVLFNVNTSNRMSLRRVGATLMTLSGSSGVTYNGVSASFYEFVQEGWLLIKTSDTNGGTWIADQILEKLNSNNQFYLHDDSPFLALPAETNYDAFVADQSFVFVNSKDVIAIAKGSTDGSGNISFEPIIGSRVPSFEDNLLYRKDYLLHIVYPQLNTSAGYPKRVKSIDLTNNTVQLETASWATVPGEVVSQDNATIPTNRQNILLVFTASAGLEDAGRIANCKGTYGKIVTQSGPIGTTRIYVNDTVGITAGASGDYVQFGHNPAKVEAINEHTPGTIVPDTTYTSQYIKPLTYVTAIGNDATFGPYIDISTTIGNTIAGPIGPYTSGLSALELPASGTLVFIKREPEGSPVIDGNGVYYAREYCVMPLDTAPPFEGTDLGLRTPSAYPNLVVQTLKFSDLEFSTSNAVAIAPGSSLTATKSLVFQNEWFDTTSGDPVFTTKKFKFLIA